MNIVFGSCDCCTETDATCLGTAPGTVVNATLVASCNTAGIALGDYNDKLSLSVFGDGSTAPDPITLPVASTSDLGTGITISTSAGSGYIYEIGSTLSQDMEGFMDVIYVDDGTATITVEFDSARIVHAVAFDMGGDLFDDYAYDFNVWDSGGNTFNEANTGGFSTSAFSAGCSNGGFFATATLGKSITKATVSFNGDDPGSIVIGTIVLCSSPAPAASRLITHDGDFLVDHDGNYLVIGA